MKILLLGKDGQVGWELQRALAPLGQVVAWGRAEADLEDLDALGERVRLEKPQVIVNAAAYTAVDKAESDVGRARRINTEAVALLAALARELDAWLVHYSTDYVFDGAKDGDYREDDPTGPQSVYGATKREGEEAIGAAACRHLVFRTSWVFATRGGNFAKTMLRLAQDREELNVVADQIGAPTSAELIADVTALCLYRLAHDPVLAARASGIYHLVAAGQTSWHQYARFVIGEAQRLGWQLKAVPEGVLPIPGSAYPTPARRPANSRLNTRKLQATFGVYLPPWENHVRRLVAELTL